MLKVSPNNNKPFESEIHKESKGKQNNNEKLYFILLNKEIQIQIAQPFL